MDVNIIGFISIRASLCFLPLLFTGFRRPLPRFAFTCVRHLLKTCVH